MLLMTLETRSKAHVSNSPMLDFTSLDPLLLILTPCCCTSSLCLARDCKLTPRNESRFLRARKFDLAQTKLMFENAEKWRKDFKVDELYESFDYKEREAVNKLYPQYYHKTDKVRSLLIGM
jgi:hypothetical protein